MIPLLHTAISTRFRDKELIYKTLYKFAFFTFFTLLTCIELTARRVACSPKANFSTVWLCF